MESTILFPQLIHKIKIKQYQTIKDRYAGKFINAFEERKTNKAEWAEFCNSWQAKDNYLYDIFNTYFSSHVNKWFNDYEYPKLEYKVDTWFNVHTYEMYQETHNHLGNNILLCGIYNLMLNEKDRPVIFNAINHQYADHIFSMGVIPTHPYFGKRSVDVLNVQEGDLLLFTPDQPHFAPCAKEKHDGYRITIAFNAHKI
tara:strand:+ start:232 stop:828 length:597 start_codon:yes stop_codon:yes gene_type:complete